jgi:nucleoid-associated protein YgaU
MADQPGFQRAYIQVDGGRKINAWFNPKEYTLARTNKWEVKAVPGAGLPPAQFGGSEPHKIDIELLFDDSDAHDGDVRRITGQLLEMMDVDEKTGSANKNNQRPPTVEFGWGPVLWPKAVCNTLSIQYTLFKPDGTPIRAVAKLNLTQVGKATSKPSGGSANRQNPAPQNPTTIAIGGIRSYTVRDGDSLQSIAYAAYGDPTLWRLVAEANEIDDPIELRRGRVLVIPRLVE